jgi:hypothetical protein
MSIGEAIEPFFAAWPGRPLLIAPAKINLYGDGNTMTPSHEVAIFRPLAVGSVAVLCTILIHALAVSATVNFFRYERKRGRAGVRLLIDLSIVVLTIAFAFVAHLIEITLWAVLFVMCGEFKDLAFAFYHSAVNYSTLGYGDVIMSPSWKLLGPLEAADGALMFGVSTAIIFSVVQRLILTRFSDLRDL